MRDSEKSAKSRRPDHRLGEEDAVTRLVRGIRYDLWVVFAVVCGMLLHAPSMSAQAQAAGAVAIGTMMHADHGEHGSGLADEEKCCAICGPAACSLGPIPEVTVPQPARDAAPLRWVARDDRTATRLDHHWPSPRGPPLPG